MDEMDDFLESGQTSDEAPEVAEQPVETPSPPRDEQGRFAPKETGVSEPETAEPSGTPPPELQEPHAPVKALQAERQKRQEAERRNAELEAYFQQIRTANPQPQQPVPVEVPDMFADPEGYHAYLLEQAEQRVMQRLAPQLQQSQVMSRAEMSEFMARQKFTDYDAMLPHVAAAVQDNPFVAQQIANAPDPASFAYNVGKKYLEAQHYGTVSPTREQIEAELREKIMAELTQNPSPQVPTTIAGDRSVGSRSSAVAFNGPTPLGDIFS